MPTTDAAATFHLRRDGVSVVIGYPGAGPDAMPGVLHWGADLGDLDDAALTALVSSRTPAIPHASLDAPLTLSLVPQQSEGWRGHPGLAGHRETGAGADSGWSPRWRVAAARRADTDGEHAVTIDARDDAAALELRAEVALAAGGVLRVQHTVRNAGSTAYAVSRLACLLPVPARAAEVLDLTGRWCRERHPQRQPLTLGARVRESRRGRTGHDASLLLVAGTPGFGFRAGEVWGLHLAWSGDHVTFAERMPEGISLIGAAELLGAGEVVLGPGESYATPPVYASWSDGGLDGLSARLHTWVRARPSHPRRPRPVVLNTWEAVYFDHDLDRLRGLADVAAGLGVERFVLDDGWFRGRRDDTAGLGDWYVDETVWPHGLAPLVEHVRGLGMEFGLWVEPEMVNPDSDMFRTHPEWALQVEGRLPLTGRHQQVVDIAHPGAYAYLLERLDALLSDNDIAYLKWDHNRDLVDAGHDGRPGVHAQTLAVYRLLDELRSRHPGVEIESCASGGGRVDLGILARTDRVWASDTNDALERQAIQRWTQLLLPPELVGSHVGPPVAHTTHRSHRLSLRVATALFGHFGIEWDVTAATDEDRAGLAAAIGFYKRVRGLLHSGSVVRLDSPDAAVAVHGVVAADGREAVFACVQLATSVTTVPAPWVLPGLRADVTYRVEPVHPAGAPGVLHVHPPRWLVHGGVVLAGSVLTSAGLPAAVLAPEDALLLHAAAVD